MIHQLLQLLLVAVAVVLVVVIGPLLPPHSSKSTTYALTTPPKTTTMITSLPKRVTATTATTTTKPLFAAVLPDGAASHHHIISAKKKTMIAGKIWPIVQKLQIGPKTLRKIVREIVAVTDWKDIAVLFVVAYCTLPTLNIMSNKLSTTKAIVQEEDSTVRSADAANTAAVSTAAAVTADDTTAINNKIRKLPYKLISGAARVTLLVYLVEIVCITLKVIGFHQPIEQWNVPLVFSKLAYSIWALRRFCEWKRLVLCQIYNISDPQKMGKVELLDRFLSGFSLAVVCLLLVDWFKVQMGVAVKGVVALGSVGTLAFTLASQDLVSQFISGLFLSVSNKVYAGDHVRFGDSDQAVASGKISRLGWMVTTMTESDNTITTVPNSKLANQKISNLSRQQISQVRQVLRFNYDDANQIPALLDDIKSEIKLACPKLITDGSRPFRVYWTSYNKDHLEVQVNSHFNIPPSGDQYYTNRQNVMMAINRAVKKNGMDFARL